jgi:1-acyl-sn-glycerol-3-phosphate acyltransferase
MTAGLVFPLLDDLGRARRAQHWSAQLLDILSVHVETGGSILRSASAPVMIVANHVSWLDIHALNSVRAARFVAKSEVRSWPVIGWLCSRAGTLFIQRARRAHTAHINERIEEALRKGEALALFPESTTSPGDVVLPFHASLLEPAVTCGALLLPVAIRYARVDGVLCSEADYTGSKSFLDSLCLMVSQPTIRARLEFLGPIACIGKHRRELAREAECLIARALGVPVSGSRGPAAALTPPRLQLRQSPRPSV